MEPLFAGGTAGLISVLVATPFLFVGFDVVPQSAEEVNLEYRKIGQVLLVSVFMAIFWYVMIMVTIGSSLPVDVLGASELAAADGMAALWSSPMMGQVLVLGGIAGLLTSWNGFLIGASRLLYAMARTGMLPAWFAKLHPTFRSPANAILFIGALSMIAPFFGRKTLVWLVNAGGLAIILAWLMVAVNLRRPAPPRAADGAAVPRSRRCRPRHRGRRSLGRDGDPLLPPVLPRRSRGRTVGHHRRLDDHRPRLRRASGQGDARAGRQGELIARMNRR